MRGTEEYNQKLSERRAAAVAAYLVSEGISQDRITTIGYGETRPAEQEVSAAKSQMGSAAAKANKRVVFTVTVK
jgi:outer membrane protein OmpA-like peptidoglycan-associated protein